MSAKFRRLGKYDCMWWNEFAMPTGVIAVIVRFLCMGRGGDHIIGMKIIHLYVHRQYFTKHVYAQFTKVWMLSTPVTTTYFYIWPVTASYKGPFYKPAFLLDSPMTETVIYIRGKIGGGEGGGGRLGKYLLNSET